MRAALALALVAAAASGAQAETLVFTRIDVVARLDPAGAVSVSETHDIAVGEEIQDFTWDVGLAAGQSFVLGRLVRVLDDGSERPLAAGDPTRDESYFLGRAWLRIGLKGPGEAIAGQRRVYRIEYALAGALTPAWDLPAGSLPLDATQSGLQNPLERLRQVRDVWGEAWPALDRHYRIDHDVLFPSRAGPAFALRELNYRLEWDEKTWRLLFPERDAGRATQGIDYRVQRTLEYLPAGRPAGVDLRGPTLRMTAALLAVPLVGLLLWLLLLLLEAARTARMPRFDPAVFESVVVSQPPELVRSLLSGQHLPPDAESLLLRLAAERKLAIRVLQPSTDEENAKTGLRLLVDPSQLRAYEADLVSALFDPGARETTTDRVQERYKGEEFDPDDVIAGTFGGTPLASMGRRAVHSLLRLLLVAAGLVLAIKDLQQSGMDPYALAAGLVVGGVLAAFFPSAWWRGVTPAAALALLVPLAILSVVGVALALAPNRPLGPEASLALAALVVSHFAGYLASLPRPAGEPGALLEQLWRARRWATAELRRAKPRLRDTWVPHLEALFLEKPLEAWRRAHGGHASAGPPDPSEIESGQALAGPAFTGNAPPLPVPADPDWSGGFWVWESEDGGAA